MPPIRCSASFSAGISSSQGRITRARPRPTSLTVMRRSSTQARASLSCKRLGQQLVQVEHLDAALAHLEHEVVVVLLGLLRPRARRRTAGRRRCPGSGADGPGPDGRPSRCAACRLRCELRISACLAPFGLFRQRAQRKDQRASSSGFPNHFVYKSPNSSAANCRLRARSTTRRKSSSPRGSASARGSIVKLAVEDDQIARRRAAPGRVQEDRRARRRSTLVLRSSTRSDAGVVAVHRDDLRGRCATCRSGSPASVRSSCPGRPRRSAARGPARAIAAPDRPGGGLALRQDLPQPAGRVRRAAARRLRPGRSGSRTTPPCVLASVAVSAPHSRSTLPCCRAPNRSSTVTGTHSTVSVASPSSVFTCSRDPLAQRDGVAGRHCPTRPDRRTAARRSDSRA